MAVHVIIGDLLNAKESIIGHQVNCQGVMGSGIAKVLRERYNTLYPSYKPYCDQHQSPDKLLGKCHIVKEGSTHIANLFGQLDYGRQKGRVYTNYEALRTSLTTLREYAVQNHLSVALPYGIGCGLANGDWNVASEILEEVFADYDVILYKLEG